MTTIHRLHHCAYPCRDAEATRAFYEDVLGLPLARAVEIRGLRGAAGLDVLQFAFRLGDGSTLAFFATRATPAAEPDAALRLAFDVDADALSALRARALAAQVTTHAIGEAGQLHALLLHDPNGYAVELRARCGACEPGAEADDARRALLRWQSARRCEAPS